MQISSSVFVALLSSVLSLVAAASSWGFTEATLSVQSKGQGVGGGLKEKLAVHNVGENLEANDWS